MPHQIIPRDRNYITARVVAEDRGYGTDCWIWQRALDRRGYGDCETERGGRHTRAHRIAYEAFVGAIPDGLQIDHLCRVPACCNPDHLEAVTGAENTRRAATHRAATHCQCGAELKPPASRNHAKCKPCWAAYMREWSAGRKARGFNPYSRSRESMDRQNTRRRAAYARRAG